MPTNKETHSAVRTQLDISASNLFERDIGTPIILPVGNSWRLHTLSTNGVPLNPFTTRPIVGGIRIISNTSDIFPESAAFTFPLSPIPTYIAASDIVAPILTNYLPIDFIALGGSSIQLRYVPFDQVPYRISLMAAITYSLDPPPLLPAQRLGTLHDEISTVGETQLGDFTLSESASQITGIIAHVIWTAQPTDLLPLLASIRLSSTSTKIQPCEFPCDASYFTNTVPATFHIPASPPRMVPLSIDTTPGAIISVFCNLQYAPSVPVQATVHLFYR